MSLHDVLWQTPACLVSWIAAGIAKRNGTEGVGRKVDQEAIMSRLEEIARG